MTDAPCPEASEACARHRRHAAGQDPLKRDQILDGAWRVFMEQGFDTATMNSICKAAGVSKGTLYVYFENKEDLFVALVETRREAFFETLQAGLSGAGTVTERLEACARALTQKLTSDEVIRLQRIVVAVVERMPELGQRFYDAGATHFYGMLQDFLRREAAAGTLAIDDMELAAAQFVELAGAGLWRARLFGRRTEAPDAAEIDRASREAVRMFLAAYRA